MLETAQSLKAKPKKPSLLKVLLKRVMPSNPFRKKKSQVDEEAKD